MLCVAFTTLADPVGGGGQQRVIVFIDGQLRYIPFTQSMTLTKALLAIGSFAEFSQKAIFLERNKIARSVDLPAIIDGRATDIMLEPSDIIEIGLPSRP